MVAAQLKQHSSGSGSISNSAWALAAAQQQLGCTVRWIMFWV